MSWGCPNKGLQAGSTTPGCILSQLWSQESELPPEALGRGIPPTSPRSWRCRTPSLGGFPGSAPPHADTWPFLLSRPGPGWSQLWTLNPDTPCGGHRSTHYTCCDREASETPTGTPMGLDLENAHRPLASTHTASSRKPSDLLQEDCPSRFCTSRLLL